MFNINHNEEQHRIDTKYITTIYINPSGPIQFGGKEHFCKANRVRLEH